MKAKKPAWFKPPKKATKKQLARAKKQARAMAIRIKKKLIQL